MPDRVIDAHLHLSHIRLFAQTANDLTGVEYNPQGLSDEMEQFNIAAAIGMGLSETEPGRFPDPLATNPMGLTMDHQIPHLYVCLGINPWTLDAQSLENLRQSTQEPSVVGLKLYAGYYHVSLLDAMYQPIYELAAELDLPIVIHGGDTYSIRGVMRYSHPLAINELAVQYPRNTFIMAHFGNPWVMDAAVTITNHPNVYADMSGIILGGDGSVGEFMQEPLMMNYVKTGILYSGHYDKFLFGTDWPLVPIGPYIRFVENLFPAEYHDMVFYENALRVFPRLAAGLRNV